MSIFDVLQTRKALKQILTESNGILRKMSSDNLMELQCFLLTMYDDIAEACKSNNITPILAYGSALGAIRHKGFIPWDDDLDLFMTRKDFECFKQIFQCQLGSKYELCAPNYGNTKRCFAKITAKNTTFLDIANVGSDLPSGIFVDIFIIENLTTNKFARFIKKYIANSLIYISSSVYCYQYRSNIEREYMSQTKATKINYNIRKCIGFVFSLIRYQTWANWFDRFVQCKKETGLVHIPSAEYDWNGYNKELFYPLLSVKFHDRVGYIHNAYDTIFKKFYGDYMQLPPVEERGHHYCIEFSTTHSRQYPIR